MPFDILLLASFVFGSCVGSFLNVCVCRIPQKISLVFPPSHCPSCKAAIPFYLNVPIFGFLLSKGKCFHCGIRISWRYPLIEALTGLLCTLAFIRFGPSMAFVFYFAFISCLVVISCIDFDLQIIPDVISLPGIVLFFFSFLFTDTMTAMDAFLGILAGGGIPWAIGMLYYLVRKTEGLGGGDVKLLAMIGAATGVRGVLFSLIAGSFAGILCGVAAMAVLKKSRQDRLPFGPCLSLGAILYLLWGDQLITAYVGFIQSLVSRIFY